MIKVVCLAVFVAVASADVSDLFNKPNYQPFKPTQYYKPNYQPLKPTQYYKPSYQPFKPTQYYKPTPTPFPALPVSPNLYKNQPSRTGEATAAILRLDSDIKPDGSYEYAYETQNGIAAQQAGALKQIGNDAAVVVQGSYQYPNEAGGVQISYTADENGYQAVGNVIPTPHPIPEAILRSIQFNEANAKAAGPQNVYQRY